MLTCSGPEPQTPARLRLGFKIWGYMCQTQVSGSGFSYMAIGECECPCIRACTVSDHILIGQQFANLFNLLLSRS